MIAKEAMILLWFKQAYLISLYEPATPEADHFIMWGEHFTQYLLTFDSFALTGGDQETDNAGETTVRRTWEDSQACKWITAHMYELFNFTYCKKCKFVNINWHIL